MKNSLIHKITSNAIVVCLYFLLSVIASPISFLGMQIRIAEALVLLCFFRRDFSIGITLGCILANLLSPLGLFDVLFGSLATLLSCVVVSFFKHLLLASLIPVLINSFVVGAELYFLMEQPFWINVGYVALGELIAVTIIGYTLFMILGRRKFFHNVIGSTRNLTFIW